MLSLSMNVDIFPSLLFSMNVQLAPAAEDDGKSEHRAKRVSINKPFFICFPPEIITTIGAVDKFIFIGAPICCHKKHREYPDLHV